MLRSPLLILCILSIIVSLLATETNAPAGPLCLCGESFPTRLQRRCPARSRYLPADSAEDPLIEMGREVWDNPALAQQRQEKTENSIVPIWEAAGHCQRRLVSGKLRG